MSQVPYAGVDIGGTKISALITNAAGAILGRSKKKTRPEKGFEAVVDRAAACLREACEDAQVDVEELGSVGVGAPSPILPDGTAIAAPNMGWKSVPLGPALSKKLGKPIAAENDCNVGTFGEYALNESKPQSLIGLFMGTGLGGGVVLGGQLVTGHNSLAAEIGHMTVELDGRPCGCGKRGCLETYASKKGMGYSFKKAVFLDGQTTVLSELIEDQGYDNVRSSLLRKAWDAKDEVTRSALADACKYLGLGIGNLVTILGPERIVLGGGVFAALGAELLPLVKHSAKQHTFPQQSYDDVRIELARLGDDAVALGAMAFGRQRAGA